MPALAAAVRLYAGCATAAGCWIASGSPGSRRLGENDAWLVATAESIDADLVGADRAAFERLGARYLRFR